MFANENSSLKLKINKKKLVNKMKLKRKKLANNDEKKSTYLFRRKH